MAIAAAALACPARADRGAPSGRTEAAFIGQVREGLELPSRMRRASMGFYPPRGAPGSTPSLEAASAAVARVSSDWSRCTGVYISRDGYLLTAAHCLRDHLRQLSRFEAADLSVWEHPQSVVFYGGGPTDHEADGRPVFLAAAGRGFLSPRRKPPNVTGLANDARMIERLAAVTQGDWAIVKVELPAPGPCLPARERSPAEGEPVWAVGYPGPASRPGGHDSNGSDLRWAHGNAAVDFASSAWLDTLDPAGREVFLGIYRPGVEAGRLILSDMDSVHGLSGAPILTAEGELTGVLTASGQTRDRFFDRSTLGVSVQAVMQDLRGLGADPALFFDCR